MPLSPRPGLGNWEPAAGEPPARASTGALGSGVATAALIAGLALYAGLSHWLMVHAPDRSWTVALLFGPLVGAAAIAGWKRRHLPTLAICAAAVAFLAWLTASGAVVDLQRLYVLQHGAVHAMLAFGFAITLRPGETPLISAIASRLHRGLSAPLARYTRKLTAAWVVYFAAMIVLSLAIYAFAPWSWWSLFCNVLTPLAAFSFFAGELLLRRVRHPEFERTTMAEAWRAYRSSTSGPSA